MGFLYPQRDMAKKSRAWITDAISGSFSEDKAKAEKIKMDDLRGWQRLADSLRLHPKKPGHPSEGRSGNGA